MAPDVGRRIGSRVEKQVQDADRVLEGWMQLGVLRIASVILVFERDTVTRKNFRLDIVACGGPGKIVVATGRDYRDAAPITGISFGPVAERLIVNLAVEQQTAEQ